MHLEVFIFFLLKALLLLSVQGSTTVQEKVPVQKAGIGEHVIESVTKIIANQSNEDHLMKPVNKPLDNQSQEGGNFSHLNESLKHESNISVAKIDNKTEIINVGNQSQGEINSKSDTIKEIQPTNISATEPTKIATVISNNQTSAMINNHTSPSPTTVLHSSTLTPNPTSNVITEKLSSTIMPSTSKNLDNTTPMPQTRQFDGPSFIGGIVLTVGLTAIGFIAFKFYKADRSAKSENYRKL